jgi:hypothetical protein
VRPWHFIDGVTYKSKNCFLSYSALFKHFEQVICPGIQQKKRTIKKLYCIGKKCYVLLCRPLQTAPPTGEAAKLASDVAQITSYIFVHVETNPSLQTYAYPAMRKKNKNKKKVGTRANGDKLAFQLKERKRYIINIARI